MFQNLYTLLHSDAARIKKALSNISALLVSATNIEREQILEDAREYQDIFVKLIDTINSNDTFYLTLGAIGRNVDSVIIKYCLSSIKRAMCNEISSIVLIHYRIAIIHSPEALESVRYLLNDKQMWSIVYEQLNQLVSESAWFIQIVYLLCDMIQKEYYRKDLLHAKRYINKSIKIMLPKINDYNIIATLSSIFNVCANCGNTEAQFKKCFGCFKARYCSILCKCAHWHNAHRRECSC